jgi:hypothetical protein
MAVWHAWTHEEVKRSFWARSANTGSQPMLANSSAATSSRCWSPPGSGRHRNLRRWDRMFECREVVA